MQSLRRESSGSLARTGTPLRHAERYAECSTCRSSGGIASADSIDARASALRSARPPPLIRPSALRASTSNSDEAAGAAAGAGASPAASSSGSSSLAPPPTASPPSPSADDEAPAGGGRGGDASSSASSSPTSSASASPASPAGGLGVCAWPCAAAALCDAADPRSRRHDAEKGRAAAAPAGAAAGAATVAGTDAEAVSGRVIWEEERRTEPLGRLVGLPRLCARTSIAASCACFSSNVFALL